MPGGGQKDHIFQRLKAKLTGGKYDGIGYFSFLEKKISSADGDIIINNMKKDPDGYPMLETGSTSGEDEFRYQKWIVERYLLKESFTESFTDTTEDVEEEKVDEEEKEELLDEQAQEIVDEAEEEVKENIDEAVEVVDEVVVNNPVKKTAPDLSDIVDLLPPGMLAAVNQQTGQNYEKTPKTKKKVESISNAKILKTMTASLEKIQGQLSSIDNELKKQNELLGAAVGTTVSNLNQIETTYDALNDRFDDILNAFQADYEAEKKRIDDEETAAAIDDQRGQDDMAENYGVEKPGAEKKKGGGLGGLLRNAARLLRFLKGGGLKKLMRRMRNPLKTARAFLRKGRMGITSKLRNIPGGRAISNQVQRATRFLRGGAASKTASAAATQSGARGGGMLSKLGGLRGLVRSPLGRFAGRGMVGLGSFMGITATMERYQKMNDPEFQKMVAEKKKRGEKLSELEMMSNPFGIATGALSAIPAFGLPVIAGEMLGGAAINYGIDRRKEQKAKMDQFLTELGGGDPNFDATPFINTPDNPVTIEQGRDNRNIFQKMGDSYNNWVYGTNKMEQGGSGYGSPELHGVEALIEPGFYKDLINPLGGMILAASSKVLTDAGPLAKAVAPTFQQEASKLASVFDVPTSVASTNIGGSVDAAANAINKATGVDSPAAAAAPSVEGMNVAEKEDEERKGPLGMLGGLFNRLGNLFGGGDDTSGDRGPGAGNYSGESFSTTGGAKVTDANISRGFAVRDGLGSGSSATGHTGLDIAGKGFERGTPISVLPPGEVIDVGLMGDASDPGGPSGNQGGYGNFAVVKLDNGGVIKMSHFDQVNVSKGQRVGKQSDGKFPVIGKLGNTGLSTGPHLHLDLGTGYNPANAAVSGLEDPMPHIGDLIRGGGNFAGGGAVGLNGEEQITVGEEGPEIVMKNLVYGTPPVLDHLLAMNDAGTASELIQTYRSFAPEVLEYDAEAQELGETIIVMTPPTPPEPPLAVKPSNTITRPARSITPGKAAYHYALFA